MSKTHVIDGVTYVEVDRKAKVGDLMICRGKIGEFRYTDGIYNIVNYSDSLSGRDAWKVSHCRALEPLESEEPTVDESQASPDVIDMLANLARRVTQLESQLSDSQKNIERLAEELMALKYLTQSNEGDIRMIDQRTQVIDAINKYYAEGSR